MENKHTSYTFDFTSFNLKLETDWLGRNFSLIDEADSTNCMLMKRDYGFEENGTVILAEKQLNGKGRLERNWLTAKYENLTFSILITNKKLLSVNPFIYNFGSVVAVARTIESQYQVQTGVKWPNDLLIGDRKICGILSESVISGSSFTRMVVGIGLNVNQTNFLGDYKLEPTSLALELGKEASREKLLAGILNEFEEIISLGERDPQRVLKDWKDRCPLMGDKISIQQGDVIYDGIFDDVDENGALLLRINDRTQIFHYGEVSIIQ